jgi:acetolactate synthase small subunit
MLTNGLIWEVYKVFFSKPLNQELVLRIDFSIINRKNESDLNELYVLTREGMAKSSLDKYFIQKKALSKYYIGAIILNSSILRRIKKQIKKISPEVKVTEEQIMEVIETEVLKREILESEKYKEALRVVNRVRKHKTKTTQEDEVIVEKTLKEKPASI